MVRCRIYAEHQITRTNIVTHKFILPQRARLAHKQDRAGFKDRFCPELHFARKLAAQQMRQSKFTDIQAMCSLRPPNSPAHERSSRLGMTLLSLIKARYPQPALQDAPAKRLFHNAPGRDGDRTGRA